MASNEFNTQENKSEAPNTPNSKAKPSPNQGRTNSEPKLVKPIAVNLRKQSLNFPERKNSAADSPMKVNQFINNGTIPVIYNSYYPIGQVGFNPDTDHFLLPTLTFPPLSKSLQDALTPHQNHQKIPCFSLMPQIKNFPSNTISQNSKPCCSCTKTKCVKKYCECFSKGKLCVDCCCLDCMNKDGVIEEKMRMEREGIVICTCTKSNCSKKYCDCYKAGVKCNEKCRCLNCMNKNTKEKTNKLSPISFKHRKDSKNHSNKDSLSTTYEDFCIQRISVLINDKEVSINFDNIDKEDTSLLSRKRSRSEECQEI